MPASRGAWRPNADERAAPRTARPGRRLRHGRRHRSRRRRPRSGSGSRSRRWGWWARSGCGKSVTSLAIMGLLPPENSKVRGEIVFEGRNLLTLEPHLMRDLRGARLAMIFQEPMTSLNPAYTIGDQIVEAIQRHQGLDAAAGPRARHRNAEAGAHPLAREARRRLSAQAVGRHAPARHDRHGAWPAGRSS